ncbi:MAG: hypothetical protein J6X62_03090 [Bacteroidales bacterium]|nr:hypothetical protein [Bacteroidales bacterium]
MKKSLFLIAAMVLASASVQAQLPSALAKKALNATKKAVEKQVDKTVDKAADKAVDAATNALVGDVQGELDSIGADSNLYSPERIFAKAPAMPPQAKVTEYLREHVKEHPSQAKLLMNPVTKYLTTLNIRIVDVASNVTNLNDEESKAVADAIDKGFQDTYGVTPEQWEQMTDEQRQALVYEAALKQSMATSGKTTSQAYNDYFAAEDKIAGILSAAEEACRKIWQDKYAAKLTANNYEELVGQYYVEAVPVHYKALQEAMQVRKTEQLDAAKRLDAENASQASKSGNQSLASVSRYAQAVALAYLSDGNKIVTCYRPDKN